MLLVPIISMIAFGWKPWPSPFFRPQSTPCVVSPAMAKLAVLMPPKYLSNIALLASPCTHQSVIESPCSSRSMLPFFAISTKPSCRGPCRCVVCVKVAAVFSRGGCSIISDSNFFSSGLVDDVSASINFLSASLTCVSSAGVGRGIATSGGTGAGGPICITPLPTRATAGRVGAVVGAVSAVAIDTAAALMAALATITQNDRFMGLVPFGV